jgi:hypothetical protein
MFRDCGYRVGKESACIIQGLSRNRGKSTKVAIRITGLPTNIQNENLFTRISSMSADNYIVTSDVIHVCSWRRGDKVPPNFKINTRLAYRWAARSGCPYPTECEGRWTLEAGRLNLTVTRKNPVHLSYMQPRSSSRNPSLRKLSPDYMKHATECYMVSIKRAFPASIQQAMLTKSSLYFHSFNSFS